MTTTIQSESAAKKDIQKLQRAIVDGLEDVKAQDVQVFNTEHLSPLFERVMVASGTSNRQTRALAYSVIDKVREAGFPKPRVEGEDNGEWIIVDCGAAVAHIMQPAIRQYYHLEEIWGDKPVRLKLGAPKPAAPTAGSAKATGRPSKPAGRPAVAADGSTSLRRSSAAKAGVRAAELEARRDAEMTKASRGRKAPARGAASPGGSRPAGKVLVVGKPAKKAAPKSTAKTAPKTAPKTASGKAPARKTPAKKAPARKA